MFKRLLKFIVPLVVVITMSGEALKALGSICELELTRGFICMPEEPGTSTIYARGYDTRGVWWKVIVIWENGVPVSIEKFGREVVI